MKYFHVWFQTKHKKRILIDEIDQRIHALLKQIAAANNINLLASGSLPDHMHLLIELERDQALPWVVKVLKGTTSRKISQEYKYLKLDFKINNLWARKYGAKEVPAEGLQATTRYILNQKKDLHVV